LRRAKGANTFELLKVTIGSLPSKLMLAITGATGHLGHATIQALLTKIAHSELIAVVRDPQKAARLRPQVGQIRQGDYNDTASLTAAFQGVDTVLFISTNEVDHDLRVQQHQHVVDAAKQAGVRHIVYTSALNPTPNSFFTGAASHLATEHYLQESGLTYTIFRNTLYLDVLPDFIGAQTLASGQLYAATGTGKVSYALREEIAQALATVLTESGHENQTYDIAPGPAYSMQDIAATLSEVTG
jgi:NAD(P)H dehydrogenase (quinone)